MKSTVCMSWDTSGNRAEKVLDHADFGEPMFSLIFNQFSILQYGSAFMAMSWVDDLEIFLQGLSQDF